MTAPIITADLVRRYMMAKGDPASAELAGVPVHIAVGAAAERMLIDKGELGARLGMCAAADHWLEHARFIRRNNPKAEPTDPVMLVWTVVVCDAEEILRRVGIDPARWPPSEGGPP